VPLEVDALLDDHHRGLQVSVHAGAAPQLDALGGHHVADHLAADDHRAGPDVGVDHALLADDEGVAGLDLAAELTVQHDGAAEDVLALDLRALVDEGAEVAGLHGRLGVRLA
jgi:hypothetical protein